METHQIQLQNFEINEILPGLWDKSWVRPFESIWSILNTYKKVNCISNHHTLMKAIGANLKMKKSNDYFLPYGTFCNLSSKNDVDKIISNLVPEWYITQTKHCFSTNEISVFFSDKISYCPECMKNGYHSILHQLKGVEKCPFHPQTPLRSYLKQRYVLGTQSEYKYEKANHERTLYFCARNSWHEIIDFKDNSALLLPSEWNYIPEVEEYIKDGPIRCDFDSIKVIGSDVHDKNKIPGIGSFLLKNSIQKPVVSIYNVHLSDTLIIKKMKERMQLLGIDACAFINDMHMFRMFFKYIYLQVTIIEMLNKYSADEIDYKAYQIERGKTLSPTDELGVKLLFFYFLLGEESVEECFRYIMDINTIKDKYSEAYRYYTSDICIHDLYIRDICLSAQYYILEEYIKMNYKYFKNYIRKQPIIKKPERRMDFIMYPIHIIYIEKEDKIFLYKY